MGPPALRGRHLVRSTLHLPLRGGARQVRHGPLRLDREEPLEPLHASLQLQVDATFKTRSTVVYKSHLQFKKSLIPFFRCYKLGQFKIGLSVCRHRGLIIRWFK